MFILNKQDDAAGILLALSLAVPQATILVVIFIIAWSVKVRRMKILASFTLGFIFITIVSIALRPDWPLEWLRAIVQNTQQANGYRSLLGMIMDRVPGVKGPLSLGLHLILILFLFYGWSRGMQKEAPIFLWGCYFTMDLSTIISPDFNLSYTIALIPITFFLLRVIRERWHPVGVFLVWLFLISGCLLPWIFVLQKTTNTTLQSPIFILGVVILALIGLEWVRWWAIKPPRLPFDIIREHEGL